MPNDIRTTDDKVQIAAVVTLSAALAIVVIKLLEKNCGVVLNGTSPEITAAVTVIFHAMLSWLNPVQPENWSFSDFFVIE